MRSGKYLPMLVALAGCLFPSMVSAAALEKGSSLLAIQLTRGGADANTYDGSTILLSVWPESGVQAQFWYFMAKEYAVNVDAGIGYFKESITADPASPFGVDQSYAVNSWHFRIGGDRFARLTDKLEVFAGPGIQLWNGTLTYKAPGVEDKQPSTMRYALTGRIGAHILISQNFGLIGHIGQYWGYASASKGDATTKWLPSGSEGAMGFSFAF